MTKLILISHPEAKTATERLALLQAAWIKNSNSLKAISRAEKRMFALKATKLRENQSLFEALIAERLREQDNDESRKA